MPKTLFEILFPAGTDLAAARRETKTPSPPPNLAPRGRTDNAQLHVWLPASTMAAVHDWCYANEYYLKDFIIEAIEAKLKTRVYPR
jgi:hypothetical protein